MVTYVLIIIVFLYRKLRRTFGFPVMDLTDANSDVGRGVRELEKAPKAEKPN